MHGLGIIMKKNEKKQERREKFEEIQKNEEMKRINKNKKIIRKDYNNYNSYENKIENNINTDKDNNIKNNIGRSNKLEDVYKIIPQKKNDLRFKSQKRGRRISLMYISSKY